MKKIRSDIELKSFEPVYLVYGPEAYLRRRLRDALRQAVAGTDTMNCTYREGREATIPEIREMAETLPFFAEKRLLILENTGLCKKGGEELAAYIPQIPATSVILFVEEEVDKRSRLYKAIDKCGHCAECARFSENELKQFALSYFTREGHRISADAMDLFLDRAGDDMNRLVTEMEKLSAYAAGRNILEEDVRAITSVTAQNRVFAMLDAMIRKRPKEALERYAELKALREPPMRILYLMTQQTNRLLQVKELDKNGVRQDGIAEAVGLRPFAVKQYLRQAAAFTEKELKERLEKLAELDEAIKNGKLSDALAVELAMADLGRG